MTLNFINIMIFSPLEQFTPISVLTFFGNFSLLSNISYNVLIVYIIMIFLISRSKSVTDIGFIQYVVQKLFFLVKDVSIKNIKIKKKVYILHLFVIFLFILIANLVGLFPYSFSLTSHFSVTFFLSYSFFFSMVIIGLRKNG
jgi:F0F1-type ATP synthase membrane subunit a